MRVFVCVRLCVNEGEEAGLSNRKIISILLLLDDVFVPSGSESTINAPSEDRH